MKKVISIFLACYLLLGSLSPNMDFHQWFHLSDVVEHFQLHQQEALLKGYTINVFDFIVEEYLHPDHHHENEPQEAPCNHTHTNTIDWVSTPTVISDLTEIPSLYNQKIFKIHSLLYSAGFIGGIDQPPSIV